MNKQSGINTDLGSICSKTAFGWAKKTFGNRKKRIGQYINTVDGAYAAAMDFNGMRLGMSSDGIGTKIEIAERVRKYDTLGYDLVAMTIDDLVSSGFEPSFISNILDVDFLDHDVVDELMRGLHDACAFAGITVTGGEIAELGSRISGYGKGMHFNWCATGIGMLHQKLTAPFTGKAINPGDVIISIYNPGFRSNGFSLLRKILSSKFGEKWHLKKISSGSPTWGEAALTPCLIYSPLIVKLLDRGVNINGVAHVTGGGVVDNLGRLLKHNKLGAELNELHQADDFMHRLVELGDVKLEKAYRYWNMGNGMLIVLPQDEGRKALRIIAGQSTYKGKLAGSVTDRQVITINVKNQQLNYSRYDTK